MSGIIYSGPSGDQYEAWKKEQEAKQVEAPKEEVAEEKPKATRTPAKK